MPVFSLIEKLFSYLPFTQLSLWHRNSDWHIFDWNEHLIRVEPKNGPAHVILYPKVPSIFASSDWIDVLYVDSITYLYLYLDTSSGSIFKDVGPNGVWTATYSLEWIVQKFIPHVLSYFAEHASSLQSSEKGKRKKLASWLFSFVKQFSKLNKEQQDILIQQSISDFKREEDNISLPDVTKPNELVSYLHKVQSYFAFYKAENVPASILRPYYEAYTELAQCANPEIVHLDYLQEKLGATQNWLGRHQNNRKRYQDLSTYDNILKYLKQQVTRINKIDYENANVADLISRAFIDIVGSEIIHFQQSQLNAAKDALFPLWEEYRFHYHFIESLDLPL